MATPTQKSRATIAATRAMLSKTRRQGFRLTSDIVAGIYGNLGTTEAGLSANLTGQNARSMAAIAKLQAKQVAGSRRAVGGTAATIASRYGSAMVGAAAPTLDQARGHASGGRATLAGIGGAGRTTAENAAAAMGIEQAGARTAEAGAVAQTADALLYRAKNDASLIAQQQLAIQQMRAQAALQYKYQVKYQEYLKKQEDKDPAGNLTGMTTAASTVADAAAGLHEVFNEMTPEGEYKFDSPAAVAMQYFAEQGILPDSNEGKAILVLARNLWNAGAGAHSGAITAGSKPYVLSAISTTFDTLYPNFSKHSDAIIAAVRAQLASGALETFAQADDKRKAAEWLREFDEGFNWLDVPIIQSFID